MKKILIRRKKKPIIWIGAVSLFFSILAGYGFYILYKDNPKDNLLIFPFLLFLIPFGFFINVFFKWIFPPIIFSRDGIKFNGIFYEWSKVESISMFEVEHESSENGKHYTERLALYLKKDQNEFKSIETTIFPLDIDENDLYKVFDTYKLNWEKSNYYKSLKQ
ncbi:uncharacterized membrane protein YobD (UPF0266 family) [Epilithonimonas hungarica]|jgi:hypothetical protein|uniref:hypothetical protein n=1 Tax=Epilithonimonas hungarica TaxID=454006 RepID=UPI0012C5BD75|nr:hypothetical protein [Epilithonimonas hungarica]MDP9958018.1 uncharacterized membrane protein YobD (UPF0266 family) [Epilithonimonas hungarica]MPT30938.1 hypothetical protein [Chryseobacterium sp.]